MFFSISLSLSFFQVDSSEVYIYIYMFIFHQGTFIYGMSCSSGVVKSIILQLQLRNWNIIVISPVTWEAKRYT